LNAFPSMQDYAERIFHTPHGETGKPASIFKFVDDDYMAVELFLQKVFKKKKSLSASEIADALEMDYGDVREVLGRMIKEGKLAVK
jgi:hypothetical protein